MTQEEADDFTTTLTVANARIAIQALMDAVNKLERLENRIKQLEQPHADHSD